MNTTIAKNKIALIDRVYNFLKGTKGATATLKEIEKDVASQFENEGKDKPNFLAEKIRCVIYRDKKDRFSRVCKGVYMVKGENTSGLIIHGDGRKLDEIEDNSIDLIVTDHPWEDKKAHKSGNQKNFAGDYEDNCFRYTLEDFQAKARVLKEGSFLVECIPTESFSNFDYLYEIKKLAEKAGFRYYSKLIWEKAPEGTINTGRCTKGIEDVLILTKGKPRRLSPKGKPYFTKNILSGRIQIPAPKPKDKNHQAEKPVALYQYLIEQLSLEGEVVLDQFGGSLNCIEAATSRNRFAIVYELMKEHAIKGINRLKAIPLFTEESDKFVIETMKDMECIDIDDIENNVTDTISETSVATTETPITNRVINEVTTDKNNTAASNIEETNKIVLNTQNDNTIISNNSVKETIISTIENTAPISAAIQTGLLPEFEKKETIVLIPKKVSLFQLDLLKKLSVKHTKLFSHFDLNIINSFNINSSDSQESLNSLFNNVYAKAYKDMYNRVNVRMSEEELNILESIKKDINTKFIEKINNQYTRCYYSNYVIETEDYAKFMIKRYNAKNYNDVIQNLDIHLDEYLNIISKHKSFKYKNTNNVKGMITKLLA